MQHFYVNIRFPFLKVELKLCDFVRETDPIPERQFKVQRDIQKAVQCYQEEIKQKANITKQKTIGDFFKKPQ